MLLCRINIILDFQPFYKNRKNNEEKVSEEARNKTIKIINIKDFEIPSNDYICNLYLKTDYDWIIQIKLITKKGKKLLLEKRRGKKKE